MRPGPVGSRETAAPIMKVYELINDPENWTTGANARDKDGMPVLAEAPTATCWCLAGAVIRCYPENYKEIWDRIETEQLGGEKPWDFNDQTTHDEVLAVAQELGI